MEHSYLSSVIKQFEYIKSLGDKTLAQVPSDKWQWSPNESTNSLAIMVKHLNGNMLSRWTDFLTSDGEKTWRKRDREFIDNFNSIEEIQECWNEGWSCLFETLKSLSHQDLEKEIFIRNMGHTVTEAINRQVSHYSYHVGQMVYLGKLIQSSDWQTLSIAKNQSAAYNQEKFAKEKRKEHFTDDL